MVTLHMKTVYYNPSELETEFANALERLREQLQQHLISNRITHVENRNVHDNPLVKFSLVDADGDPHEIVVRIIQVPDKF